MPTVTTPTKESPVFQIDQEVLAAIRAERTALVCIAMVIALAVAMSGIAGALG